jgi:hypothetical protein
MLNKFIKPVWPAPAQVHAYSSLRSSQVSPGPQNTKIDYDRLTELLQLPNKPIKVNQTHSNIVLPALSENQGVEADALFTNRPDHVCVISTADCLPVLLTDIKGTHVAAIHAGWRGLAKGIIAETVRTLGLRNEEILAWLGPAISQSCYEVGEEVRDQFMAIDPKSADAFIPSPNKRWLMDLYAIARLQLQKQGISQIYGGDYCTYSNPDFFSYRRDGGIQGVIATLIWISD